MITKEEVKHIAKLARLGLSAKEIGKIQKELSSILDYMEKLKEIDVSKIKPTSHSIANENATREDESSKLKAFDSSSGRGFESSRLLELAPETKNGYLKVKSIL